MIACRSRTSAAARTNESATKSTPSPSANSRSSRSFFVSDGIGIGTPGRFTPLWDFTSPPTTTRHIARPCSTSVTVSRTSPSSIRMSCPGRSTSPMTAGAIGNSLSTACCSPTTRTSSPFKSTRGASRSPMRSFGPCRSAMSANGLPSSCCTSRTTWARAPWSWCVPCERFSLIASTPASTSSRTASCVDETGPMVATIFVRRRSAVIAPNLATARSGEPSALLCLREGVPARVHGPCAELLLDPQQMVVLRDAIRPCGGARLDLPRAERHGQIGDRRVLGLAGAVRHHGGVAVRLRQPHGVDRLGEGADLVHLHEDRVRDAFVYAALEPVRVRHEHVVADELHAPAQQGRLGAPRLPVVLGGAVLDRDDRVAVDDLRPERGQLGARPLAA